MFASGSIQGRVLDASKKPLPHAFVYVVPADQQVLPERRKLYWESQSKEGFFKFVHIPPGEYLVLVNPEDNQDASFRYRRTFHPGDHDRALAGVITVRGGEAIQNADIRLQPEFTARHVGVRVTWADGRAVTHWVYIEASGTMNAELTSTASTDAKVKVGDLAVLPNEPYEVQAKLTCRYADARSSGPGATIESNKIVLRPGDGRTEIALTLPAKGCPVIPGKTLENLP